MPARLLTPAEPAEVTLSRDRLTYLRSRLVTGKIAVSEGPHRIEGEWWGPGFEREYWVVTLADGGRYWLYRDRAQRTVWRLQGVFD